MLVRVLGPYGGGSNEDGVDVPLRPMERRLLAALAVKRPAPVSVDSLAEALWPNGAPPSARKTIQNIVLRLRHKLGNEEIETVRSGYRLADDVEVDIDRFEHAARAAGREPSGIAQWDAALSWCDNDPLGELRHWPPAFGRRAELEELHRSAVEARWDAAIDQGEPLDVLPQLEALVAEDPLRERRWSLLLRAYGRAGRRAEGLRAFERARRTLATELGVRPGAELVDAYETLLRDDADELATEPPDRIALCDSLLAEGAEAVRRGQPLAAVESFTAAARLARQAADVRRFAEAALGASGEGWRTTLDATDEVVSLLVEAIDRVPPGPTPLRARLLARSAVARSHHLPAARCADSARKALAIARAIDQPELVAGALHALAVVTWDPARHHDQSEWIDELLLLADAQCEPRWHRWALPLVARHRATEGDIVGACAALDDLAEEAAAADDPVGLFGAAHGPLLRASVVGDWAEARAATKNLRSAAEGAVFEPGGPALMALGMLGILDLLSGPARVPALQPIEWPLDSMELSVRAWYANCLARSGQPERAAEELSQIDVSMIGDVERDGYWLPTMSMLADGAYLCGCRAVGDAVTACLHPYLELTIVDPGLIYRGSVAHAAGLGAATLGHHSDAGDLLAFGLSIHEAHGSPWMTQRSSEALVALGAL